MSKTVAPPLKLKNDGLASGLAQPKVVLGREVPQKVGLGWMSHGHLYRWTENSFPFFLYLKPVEISKKCFNTI